MEGCSGNYVFFFVCNNDGSLKIDLKFLSSIFFYKYRSLRVYEVGV